MQNVKQALKLERVSALLLVFFAMAMLFSCSKNTGETAGQASLGSTVANNAAHPENGNGVEPIPYEQTLFVPCANGGAGEEVEWTGNMNFVYQISWTEHGFSLVYHINFAHVTGVGLSSGETFVGSGGTQGTVAGSWVNSQWIGTTIQQMRVIGQNTRFRIKYTYHITVTPDGTVTVKINETTVDCN